jgi:predicted DNA-binding transcriptional regulator YafY
VDGSTVVIAAAILAVGVYLYSRRDRSYPVEERLPVIERAIASGRDLEMEYFTNSSKTFSKRTVTPLEVTYQYQRPYLRAYDHWRRDERTFRVSRIKSVRDVPRRPRRSSM